MGTQTRVDPNYVSDQRDIEILRKALIFCIDLLNSPEFSSFIDEIVDKEKILNYPIEYIRDNIFSGHHLIGGINSLINKDLSLKSLPNAFVCDASVFSDYAASNIHSSVVLLSDVFAKDFSYNYSS